MAIYMYLAIGCLMVGLVITFIVLTLCLYLGIDISRNTWVTAIPVTVSVILNILGVELYRKYHKK
jgi:cytochrome c biogenesis protein CcdA